MPSRVEYQLSNNRGLVKRIDYGTFSYIVHKKESQELKIILNGTLLKGLFSIDNSFCQLTKNNLFLFSNNLNISLEIF